MCTARPAAAPLFQEGYLQAFVTKFALENSHSPSCFSLGEEGTKRRPPRLASLMAPAPPTHIVTPQAKDCAAGIICLLI